METRDQEKWLPWDLEDPNLLPHTAAIPALLQSVPELQTKYVSERLAKNQKGT